MAINVSTYTGLKIPTQGHKPWDAFNNANWAQVDAYKAVRNFAVRAANYDANGNPTGLTYTIAAGDYVQRGNFGMDGTFSTAGPFTKTAPANKTTYVYLNRNGTIGTSNELVGGLFTDEDHIPLASVTANATNITAIVDYRYPLHFVKYEPITQYYRNAATILGDITTSRELLVSQESYQTISFFPVDATAGAVTLTLPADELHGAIAHVKKLDASANPVHVVVDGGATIDGLATQSITSQFGVLQIYGFSTTWHVIGRLGT